MNGKDFIKNEPICLKIISIIGIISFFINLNDLTIGKNEVNKVFPIMYFSEIKTFEQ